MNWKFSILILIAGCLSLTGCGQKPNNAGPAQNSSPDAARNQTIELNKLEPLVLDPIKLDSLEGKGVKIGWNADKTVKNLDLSEGFPEGGFFDQDPRLSAIRVVRGKGLIGKKLGDQLAQMPLLTELLWTDAVLEDNIFEPFINSPKLKKIRLTGLKTSKLNEILKSIEKLPALTDLDLSGSCCGNADLTAVKGLSQAIHLDRLNLYSTAVTDAGVKELTPLADHLTWLNLDASKITDACGPDLEKFEKLTFLHLGRSEVSDKIIPSLSKLKSLKTVHVTRTKVTEKGANELRKALPGAEIVSVVKEDKPEAANK